MLRWSRNVIIFVAAVTVLGCGFIVWAIPQVGNALAQNRAPASIDVYATLTAMAPTNTSNCPTGQVEVSYAGQYPVEFGCQPFAVATQVAIAQAELNGQSPMATPTNSTINGIEFTWQQLEAMGTPMAPAADTTDFAGQTYADGSVRVSGFPEASVPVRWGNGVIQNNTSPVDGFAWIVAEPGVLSADDIADCAGNLSCVWSGGASVDNVMENETGTYLCPEGGYVKATFPQGTMSAAGFTISVDEAAGTAYTFLARCPYAEGEGDNSLPIDFTSEHKGRMKVMRYPVPFQAGGFFSFVHLEQDVNNALGITDNFDRDGADNCGNAGCSYNVVILVDYNHGTLGIYKYDGSSWAQVYQNTQRPTPAQ